MLTHTGYRVVNLCHLASRPPAYRALLGERGHTAEPLMDAPIGGPAPAAVRDAQVGGDVAPRPAVHHPEARVLRAIPRVFEQRFRLLIKFLVVPICHPFRDVPAHVVEAIAI